jgi:alpha-1,3-mannosyltransferase
VLEEAKPSDPPPPPKVDMLKWLISIRDFDDEKTIKRVSCPLPDEKRYGYLRDLHFDSKRVNPPPYRPYLIAINLHQAAPVLPRLLGSLMPVIRLLGPQNVALSIVEGRSTDGTFEVLSNLQLVLPEGVKYFFSTSNINPTQEGRIGSLATLRNLAIEPLHTHSTLFSAENTTVIFMNDVAACPDDILELLHQKFHQEADMTCGMDWNERHEGRSRLTFYDVWIARSMSGQSFFHIPYGGSWGQSMNLFAFDNDADRLTKKRFEKFLPFQVFTCWNGGVVFDAGPVMAENVTFRVNRENECYQGEVSLFVKDLWLRGHGKIAVIPSVNVAYEDEVAKRVHKEMGLVSKWAKKYQNKKEEKIDWQLEPPEKILCIPNWVDQDQYWVPWNE